VELPFPAKVDFASPNRIPFHYNSQFTVTENLASPLRLLVPAEFAAGVTYDGMPLGEGRAVSLLDEPYAEFAVSGTAGKHGFELPAWRVRPLDLGKPDSSTGNDPGMPSDFKYYLPVYLEGDFDAALDVEAPFDHQVYVSYYILHIYDPKRCDVTLTPRRASLAAGSWATQGQPFYSGSVTYEFDVAALSGNAVLETPSAAVRVEAELDGVPCGSTGFPPFRIGLGDLTGAKTLKIRVTNTLANEYEEYLAPSGLVGGARLLFT
jgi:hypothetical protein